MAGEEITHDADSSAVEIVGQIEFSDQPAVYNKPSVCFKGKYYQMVPSQQVGFSFRQITGILVSIIVIVSISCVVIPPSLVRETYHFESVELRVANHKSIAPLVCLWIDKFGLRY